MSRPKNFYCRFFSGAWDTRPCYNETQCPVCESIVKKRQKETKRLIEEQKCNPQKQEV